MSQISIIIPVYNAERYLRQCIDSVIAQTFEDWEAILVNDGSKDGSLAMCQEYASKDDRIRVIDKPNGGVSSARNKGLEMTQGDWITFMDSDDWLDSDAFETYHDAAQRTGADIIKTGYRRVYDNGNDNNNNKKNDGYVWQEVTIANQSDALAKLQETGYYAFVWNMIVSASIAKALRFDETTPWLEDQFFGYECLLKAGKVTLLPKMVYNYRIHESGSLSGVTNPFVIAYSARKDMEYKLKIFGNKHQEIVEKCWNTYHQWQAQAIDSLYKNYGYADRERFREYSPIDGKYVYAEERKFFDGIKPFWLNDAIERLKRFIKR
jgi:glycosyltransferase involved in cell wall biosynthesis